MTNLATDANALVLPISGKTGTFGGNSWNGNLCCCWVSTDGAFPADSDYVADLVARVIAAGWPVDPKRIFGVGDSAGEGVLFRSACDHSTTWSGIAGFAGAGGVTTGGAGTDPACTPATPVHLLHAHGTSDISQESWTGNNGANNGMTNLCNAAIDTGGTYDQYRAFNGCGAFATTTASWRNLDNTAAGTETDLLEATGCPAGGSVTQWRMNGTTHTLTTTAGGNFEVELIAWMNSHPKP